MVTPEKRGGQVWRETKPHHATSLQMNLNLAASIARLCTERYNIVVVDNFCSVFNDCCLAHQARHLRRPGEEDSDVDIEGFEEDDDGKPKTPAPVSIIDLHKAAY